jgi:hypothetical protein
MQEKNGQDNNHSRAYSYVENKLMMIVDDVHHVQSHHIAMTLLDN